MSTSQFDYDGMVHTALRNVVRQILLQVEGEGLQGEHHFYIAFQTQAEGVDIPNHLVEKYPDEMTIVIQHRFWDLKVTKDYFEVGLSFNQKAETLHIPFKAIIGFVDPSAQFALQFEQIETAAGNDDGGTQDTELATDDEKAEKSTKADKKTKPKKKSDDDDITDTDNVVTLDAFRKKP